VIDDNNSGMSAHPDIKEIAEVIQKPAGYVIEICGLYVCKLKAKQGYHVVCDRPEEKWDVFFAMPYAAAAYFLRRKRIMKLGYDHEKIELPIVSTKELGEMYIG